MYQLDTPIVRTFFPLNSCVSDVKVHLRELQTTQSCVASERELILARVGLFDEKGEDGYLPKASCFAWSKILSFKKVPESAAWSP